jgi:hypothetical protein
MAATSFNGVTATIDAQAVLITSIEFAGGETALVDVTASGDGYRKNLSPTDRWLGRTRGSRRLQASLVHWISRLNLR